MTLLDALAEKLAPLDATAGLVGGDAERGLAVVVQQVFSDLSARAVALDGQGTDLRQAMAGLKARIAELDSAAAWDLGPIRALVAVPDPPSLAALLAGAAPLPGTHLCLAAGTYPGFVVPATWQSVVFRSGSFSAAGLVDAPQAAVVTGNIRVDGPGCVVAGFALTNTTAQAGNVAPITLAGAGSRATRNVVDTPHVLANGIDATASDCSVDGNEIRNFANNGICPKPGAQRVYIGWNWLHGQVAGGRPNSKAGMMIGGLIAGVTENPGGHVVEWNLLTDWPTVDGLELKSSDCILRFNTLIGSAAGQCSINVRHGPRTLIAGNTVENGSIQLGDNDSVAVGNKTAGTRNAPALRIKAGTCSPEEFLASGGGAGKYPYARNARVIWHDGDTQVGARPNGIETLPALLTSIEACPGKVTIVAGTTPASSYARSDATTWTGERPVPRRLSPADVGPLATRLI